MGNDGGSIPKRSDLVQLRKRERTIDGDAEAALQLDKWTHCTLSGKRLVKPVVSCGKGLLFNKEAILEWILDESLFQQSSSIVPHVKSLKDVVDLKLTANPNFASDSSSNASVSANSASEDSSAPFICPITQKEMRPPTSFVYVVPCGHAFAQAALELKISDGSCLVCSEKYNQRDIVTINPSRPEDVVRNQRRLDELHSLRLTHSLRQEKKKSKKKIVTTQKQEEKSITRHTQDGIQTQVKTITTSELAFDRKAITGDAVSDEDTGSSRSSRSQTGSSSSRPQSGINQSSIVSGITRKINEELSKSRVEREKRKAESSENIKSLYCRSEDNIHEKFNGKRVHMDKSATSTV